MLAAENVEDDAERTTGCGVADRQVQDSENCVSYLAVSEARFHWQKLQVPGFGGIWGGVGVKKSCKGTGCWRYTGVRGAAQEEHTCALSEIVGAEMTL